MKKIALFVFLLALGTALGRAQESRQDVSISGSGMIEPFTASHTDVEYSAKRLFGALASYRFMVTPSSALELNYGFNFDSNTHFVAPQYNYLVNTRMQEISGAYVYNFNFRNFNPFVEAGPAAFIWQPVRNIGTTTLDVKQQTTVGGIFGGGIAYEISPSFDIRAEYRGILTKVPSFGYSPLSTNKYYQIYNPVIGVAYHF